MKRWLSLILVFTMVLALFPATAASAANEGTMVLPGNVAEIEDEAFAGDTGIETLVIPKNVESIGSRAFADCSALKEVYVGLNASMKIARDAFENCSNLHFFVYSNTSGELYALAHGYTYDLLDQGSSFLDRAMELVANNGGSSILQSGEFASKRLIVCRASDRLPDISAFLPTQILREDDIFMVQFNTVDDTVECYTMLFNDPDTVFVEPDECIAALDDMTAAGVVDGNVWDTDDPMGFDVYSEFVAKNSTAWRTIAVVDSGVRKLSNYADKLRRDGTNLLAIQDGAGWEQDDQRHGSVIASVINDCVGNANVSILPVRVVGASGNSNPSMIGSGILYAIARGANVIVLSMNFKQSAYVTYCIDEAIKAGITVVVAAGNAGRNISAVYPANLPQVVTVSGIDNSYKLSAISNFGAGIDYCAPDSYVKTSAFTTGIFNGTSFAAPMIASALALVSMDPYHGVADMDATCFVNNETDSPANSYGKGMPRLDRLANIAVDAVIPDASMPDVLAVDDDLALTWSVLPENATDQTVTVVSDNESIISVTNNSDGTITAHALAAGTATLTFTSNSSGVTALRTFTVVQPVKSITITGTPAKLVIGRNAKLQAVVSPENATSKLIAWSSSNPAVASVDENGLVTGKAEGEVTITATARDGYGAYAVTSSIQVVDEPDAEGIVLTIDGQNVTNGTIQMAPGDIREIKASVLPADADQTVTYTAVGNYVTVTPTGVVTAVNPGTAYIYVSNRDGTVHATLEIKVAVLPTDVTIQGNTTIDEGASSQLTAVVGPSNVTDGTVTWKTSNSDVAVVSTSGVVTGKMAGSAIITAQCNGDPSVTAQVTVTIRHPFTISFELNKPAAASGTPVLTGSSTITAYSGYAIGALPTAQLDYYTFNGWYSAPSGGTRMTETSAINTGDSSVTLYAQWTIHAESGWVLTSAVPAGAMITQTSYSYRESTESTSSSMSGWVSNGNYWKQTGSGSAYYASFPSGYDTGNKYYKDYMKSAYTASETETNKRTVSNVQEGWIYWHWMYNVKYASGTTRAISSKKGTYGSSNFYYGYFYAMASNTDCPYLSKDYCNNQNVASYNAKSVVNAMASSTDKTNTKSGLGTDRFFRFNRYKSTYTDYVKYYMYYRDLSYQATNPGSGASGVTISNLTTYVKYRVK